MIDVRFHYYPVLYRECDINKDDVQILYVGETGQNVVGHFICVFFKAKNKVLYVYDSLNRKVLHERQMVIIENRYPKRKEILFVEPKILQIDNTSCGPTSIAIATAIILGKDPLKYELKMNFNGVDHSMFLRAHIKKIFEDYRLSPFPQENKNDDL